MTADRPPVDAVVVGAGLMGRWHAHAVRRTGGRVRAVVDPDPARARELASRHRGARAFVGLEEAVDAVPADVAHVCSPTATHVELVERSLDAGLHVLVEKPLAPDAAATRRLLERAEGEGRVLCPVHQFVFQRGALGLRERAASLGAVRQADAVFRTAGGRGRDAAGLRELAAEILPHPLSLVDRFLPDGLRGLEWWIGEAAPGEQRIVALGDGVSAGISISARARPTRAEFVLAGEEGSARLDLYHGYAVHLDGRVSRLRKAALPFLEAAGGGLAASANLALRALRRQPAYPGLRELVARFHEGTAAGRAPVPAGATLRVAEARDRLLRLLDGGRGG